MSPRADIAMTAAEIDAFLTVQSEVVIGTLTADGMPAATVARCDYDGDAMVISLPAGSAAVDDLRRDPRMCCIAEQFATYYEIKGVIVHGRADLGGTADGRQLVRVPLADVVSFDFAKLPRPGSRAD
jgi:hypothetical protein